MKDRAAVSIRAEILAHLKEADAAIDKSILACDDNPYHGKLADISNLIDDLKDVVETEVADD